MSKDQFFRLQKTTVNLKTLLVYQIKLKVVNKNYKLKSILIKSFYNLSGVNL
jgi:hypothetical protein